MFNKKYSTTQYLIKNKPNIVNSENDIFKSILFLPKNKNRKIEGGLRTEGFFKKSYKNIPLLTVITVVLNGYQYIDNTIKSVINQTYANIEYILIDGGSCDGTINIIEKYRNKIDYFVSEKDLGIYDAMNKGIMLSQGSTILILNVGDTYGVNHVKKILNNLQDEDLNDKIIYTDYKYFFDRLEYYQEKESTSKLDRGMTLCHQSMFVGKNVYGKIGLYSLDYRFASDYEYALRAKKNNIFFEKSYFSNEVLFLYGGASNDNLFISKKEAMCINRKYFGILSIEHLLFIYSNFKSFFKILLLKIICKIIGFDKINYLILIKKKSKCLFPK